MDDSSAADLPRDADAPPPIDFVTPQFTLRAVVTGMVLGGLLSACNIYASLQIGWSTNMSLVAVLISYGFWAVCERILGTSRWTMLENNINQAAASAGAAVSSAGLAAAIPALTLLTGEQLAWHWLATWVFSVCIVGIVVAIPLRKQMVIVEKLPFPAGLATAKTLQEMYAAGAEALSRISMLVGGAIVGALVKLLETYRWLPWWSANAISWIRLEKWGIPIPAAWLFGFEAKALTFSVQPTLLMVGIGGIVGFRTGFWMLGGAVLAWLVVAPPLIDANYIRLSHTEPLVALDASVSERLPRPPNGYLQYSSEQAQLEFKGVMTQAERDDFLRLSDDAAYQDAVARLYMRSQLRIAAPLTALPAGVQLSGTPLEFDNARKLLIARRGLDRASFEKLCAATDSAELRTALQQVFDQFDCRTSQRIEFRERVAQWPAGVKLARRITNQVHYHADDQTIRCTGALSENARDGLRSQFAHWNSRGLISDASRSSLSQSLDNLFERSHHDLHAEAVSLSTARVEYDPAAQSLSVRGVLTTSAASSLAKSLPKGSELALALTTLAAHTSYSAPRPNFGDVTAWLLWPGVTLLVVSSLASLLCSWGSIGRAFSGLRAKTNHPQTAQDTGEVPLRWFIAALAISLVLSVVLQVQLFSIAWWAATLGVFLSFVLAVVAARVSGETNVTPIGPMGKVTQLVFGIIVPQNPAPNLMAANVTGGAASQCADLMHDLKTGHMIGAVARYQALSQMFGALAGSLLGSLWYLILIPNPREDLLTTNWPAPSVATWKAVAELFMVGLAALPRGAPLAMTIAAVLGVLLPLAERGLPARYRWLVPSASAIGLAFIINAYDSISMFLGGLIALLLSRVARSWTERLFIVLCCGIVAGESLTGIGIAMQRMFWP